MPNILCETYWRSAERKHQRIPQRSPCCPLSTPRKFHFTTNKRRLISLKWVNAIMHIQTLIACQGYPRTIIVYRGEIRTVRKISSRRSQWSQGERVWIRELFGRFTPGGHFSLIQKYLFTQRYRSTPRFHTPKILQLTCPWTTARIINCTAWMGSSSPCPYWTSYHPAFQAYISCTTQHGRGSRLESSVDKPHGSYIAHLT